MRAKFTQAARKHRIGRTHAVYVMATSIPTVGKRPNGEPELQWVGADSRGVELEILAAVTPDTKTGEPMILVLHVMPTNLRKGQR